MCEKGQRTEAGSAVIRTLLTSAGVLTAVVGCYLGIGEKMLYPEPSDPPVNPVALVMGGVSLAVVSELANRNN